MNIKYSKKTAALVTLCLFLLASIVALFIVLASENEWFGASASTTNQQTPNSNESNKPGGGSGSKKPTRKRKTSLNIIGNSKKPTKRTRTKKTNLEHRKTTSSSSDNKETGDLTQSEYKNLTGISNLSTNINYDGTEERNEENVDHSDTEEYESLDENDVENNQEQQQSEEDITTEDEEIQPLSVSQQMQLITRDINAEASESSGVVVVEAANYDTVDHSNNREETTEVDAKQDEESADRAVRHQSERRMRTSTPKTAVRRSKRLESAALPEKRACVQRQNERRKDDKKGRKRKCTKKNNDQDDTEEKQVESSKEEQVSNISRIPQSVQRDHEMSTSILTRIVTKKRSIQNVDGIITEKHSRNVQTLPHSSQSSSSQVTLQSPTPHREQRVIPQQENQPHTSLQSESRFTPPTTQPRHDYSGTYLSFLEGVTARPPIKGANQRYEAESHSRSHDSIMRESRAESSDSIQMEDDFMTEDEHQDDEQEEENASGGLQGVRSFFGKIWSRLRPGGKPKDDDDDVDDDQEESYDK